MAPAALPPLLAIHFGARSRATSDLRGATFPGETSTRFLIHDNDAIFSDRVTQAINQLGIEPKRIAYRSPWQNGSAERWIGTVRRELLDHVIVIDATAKRLSDVGAG